MALHLVLSRWYTKSPTTKFNISRLSFDSESEEWSTINLYPQFPKEFIDYYYQVECNVNGLVVFSFENDVRDYFHVIWNPSTNKFQWIPPPEFNYAPCWCSSRRCVSHVYPEACGFSFVAESHEYKFFRFTTNYNKVPGDHDHWTSDHFAVYSSKNNSWKEVFSPFYNVGDEKEHIIPAEFMQVATCVNGICYWTTESDVIISFDVSSDEFSTLPYPDDIAPDSVRGDAVFLLEFDGSLCLVIEFQSENTKTKLFSFWVYQEYQGSPASLPWTRKINLDVRLDANAEKPLWLGNKNINSLVLLLQGFDGALLEYDYTTTELKKIDQIHDHHHSKMIISPYVETNINSTCEVDGWRAHLRPHSKVKGSNDDVVDRISELCDEIIVSILSSLSLKEAASTSVLSTRWSDVWRYTPNLNFPYTRLKRRYGPKPKPKYRKWVNSVVESHKALSLNEFNISFPLSYSTRHTVTKWLEFAFSRRVQVLELNLFGRRFSFLEKSFLRKSSIFESSNLKSLRLKCLKVSGEAIGLFLRNCPLIEELIIKYAILTSNIEVCGGSLKHVDIQGLGAYLIKGYVPNLTCLKITKWPFITDFVGHPKLPLATHQSAGLFCINTPQLTTLKFTLCRPSKSFFEKGFPQMPTLRKLIITFFEFYHYHGDGEIDEDGEIDDENGDIAECAECAEFGVGIRPLTSLICAFPHLEEFEIKCKTRNYFKQGMKAENNVERFCHWHLRVLKFTRFDVRNDDHMEFVSYILDNCAALQKMILDIQGVDSPSYVAAGEYAKQLQSKIPTHLQLIITYNNRQLL